MNRNYFVGFFFIIQTWLIMLLPSLLKDEHINSIISLFSYIIFISFFCSLILKLISNKYKLEINFYITLFFLIIFYFGIVLSTLDFFLGLVPIYKIVFLFISLMLISGLVYFLISYKHSATIR